MANKEIHELITAEELSANDVLAEQRDGGGTWLTRKLTFNALGLFLNKVLNYASDLHTTNKTIIDAINEVNSATSGVTKTGTLEAGETSLVFTDNSITDDSLVDWYIEEAYYGIVAPTAFTTDAANHTLTLTFDAQEEDIDIKVVIK
jgi:hypothetical protein